jgi:hypothetical protein
MNPINLSELSITINNAVAGDEVKSVIHSLIENFRELKGLRSDVELSYKFGTDEFIKSLKLPKSDESSIVLKYCCTGQPIFLLGENKKIKKEKTAGNYPTECKIGQGEVRFFLRQRNGKHNFTDVPIDVTNIVRAPTPVIAYLDPEITQKISNNAQIAMARGNYAARANLVSNGYLPDASETMDKTTTAIQTAVRDGILSQSGAIVKQAPSQTAIDLGNIYATVTGKPISIVGGNNPLPLGDVESWTSAIIGPDGVKLVEEQAKHLAGGCGSGNYFNPYLSAIPVQAQVMVVPGPASGLPTYTQLYGGFEGGADVTVTQVTPNLSAVLGKPSEITQLPTNTVQIKEWMDTLSQQFKDTIAKVQSYLPSNSKIVQQKSVVKGPDGSIAYDKLLTISDGKTITSAKVSSENKVPTSSNLSDKVLSDPMISSETKKASYVSMNKSAKATPLPSETKNLTTGNFVQTAPSTLVPVVPVVPVTSLSGGSNDVQYSQISATKPSKPRVPDFTSSIRFDMVPK